MSTQMAALQAGEPVNRLIQAVRPHCQCLVTAEKLKLAFGVAFRADAVVVLGYPALVVDESGPMKVNESVALEISIGASHWSVKDVTCFRWRIVNQDFYLATNE